MSLVDLYVTAGSLVIVAGLTLIAFLMGFRESARIGGREDLERAIDESEPGARLEGFVLDARGRAGLAQLADGRLVVARAVGDKVSVRAFPAGKVRARLKGAMLILAFADAGFPQLRLQLADSAAPAWLAELATHAGALT